MEHHKHCLNRSYSFRHCTCQPRLLLADSPITRLARFAELLEALRKYDIACITGREPELLAQAEADLMMCARRLVATDQGFLDALAVNLSSGAYPSNHPNTLESIQKVFASLRDEGQDVDMNVSRTDMQPSCV